MIVTTSREPSARTRRVAKTLTRFLSLSYVNRGKRSMEDDETWMVVVENHGNPHGFVKRTPEEEIVMNFNLSGGPKEKPMKKMVPVVQGIKEEAIPVARFFDLDTSEGQGPAPRAIIAVPGSIEFVDDGVPIMRLKV
jgi:U3 small nucleolar ribonucleoprotein protein IMP4